MSRNLDKLLKWLVPRGAWDIAFKSGLILTFMMVVNIVFAKVYLGYQPVGLDYYLFKSIVVMVPFLVPFFLLLQRQDRTEARLRLASRIDGLTEVLNRRTFLAEVEKSLCTFQSGVLLMIDADHFKSINDDYGHDVGDICLQAIAYQLRYSARETDVVGRVGGEEFAVFLSGATLEKAKVTICRLLLPVSYGRRGGDKGLTVTLSGGATAIAAGEDLLEAMARADQALYDAKETGRARLCFWEDGHEPLIPMQLEARYSAVSARTAA